MPRTPSFYKVITEDSCSYEEQVIAERIAMEMEMEQSVVNAMVAAGHTRQLSWRRVELDIHNWDLSQRDQCRWWNFEKAEAMDDDWDESYAKLRAAAGSPVYRGSKK
jgi:hypothetical protein